MASVTVDNVISRTLTIKLPNGATYNRLDLIEGFKEEHFDLKKIEALGPRKQNSVWYVTLTSEEATAELLEKGQIDIRGRTGFIFGQGSSLHRMRIHWAPYFMPQATLIAHLKRILPTDAKIEGFGFEKSKIQDAQHIATGVRYVIIRYSGAPEDLPHLINAPTAGETWEILCTVQGRQPICLNCKSVGHIRSQCKVTICNKCGEEGHRGYQCYAHIAGRKTRSVPDAEMTYEEEEEEEVEREKEEETQEVQLGQENIGLSKLPQDLATTNNTDVSNSTVDIHKRRQESAGTSMTRKSTNLRETPEEKTQSTQDQFFSQIALEGTHSQSTIESADSFEDLLSQTYSKKRKKKQKNEVS